MSQVDRKVILKSMRICRFCLTDQEPLTSIYEKDVRSKNLIPLPLQIMACVSIEVFQSDGMPQLICKICRLQTSRSYKFKTHCKQSDDALKLFLATGNFKKPNLTIKEVLELDEEEPEDPLKLTEESPKPQGPPAKRAKPNSSTTQKSENVERHQATQREKSIQEEIQMEEGEIYQEDYSNENATKMEDVEELEDLQDEENENYEFEGTVEESVDSRGEVTNITPNLSVYACTKCDRSFPLQQLLEIHMRNHGRERKFSCRRCNKLFFSKYDLAKHTAVHTGEKPYQCVACLKTFARPTLLHRHEKIHVEIPKYLCTTCDRTFLALEELERHEQIHKKARPYSCDKCDKSFAFKQGLERHQETHRTDKPHKCNYCTESFDTPAKLARHVTTHAGIRPYPCKYCHRTFLLSHHLTRHLRGHYANPQQTSSKPQYNYKCSECTMQYKRKDGLIGHSTIHSMVSLKCIFCFKQFDDLKLVREHVKSHMYGNIYPCEKCNYLFITAKHLEDHEQNQCVGNLDKEEEEFELFEATNANNDSINIFTDPENSINDEEDNTQDGKSEADEAKMNTSEQDNSVRRSSRPTKIKDYAQFIKDELGSESEHDSNAENDDLYEEDENTQQKKVPKKVEDTIKPIIKPDGTKTYASKGQKKQTASATIVKPTETPQPTAAPTPSVSIDLPQEKWTKGEIMEMKIGEKIVKVQKVLMSKAEVEEMARQGKIKMKGGAMLLKQPIKKSAIDGTKLKSPIAASTPLPKIKKNITANKKDENETTPKKSTPSIESNEIKKSVRTYGTKKVSTTTPVKIKEEQLQAVSEETGEKTTADVPEDTSQINVK
ncbi:protein suppressor of hairy wing-like [Chrysoperla carnea]|uniref:protein suppressor of hairy wing-like n=1 Tax=Chrysoperla carnea TaxID=189513 RepID=UPI001D0612F2|nr:protein suppressor of hairy wing-like [Chrysoperla carnea]